MVTAGTSTTCYSNAVCDKMTCTFLGRAPLVSLARSLPMCALSVFQLGNWKLDAGGGQGVDPPVRLGPTRSDSRDLSQYEAITVSNRRGGVGRPATLRLGSAGSSGPPLPLPSGATLTAQRPLPRDVLCALCVHLSVFEWTVHTTAISAALSFRAGPAINHMCLSRPVFTVPRREGRAAASRRCAGVFDTILIVPQKRWPWSSRPRRPGRPRPARPSPSRPPRVTRTGI